MLSVLATNINRKITDGRFYEISKRFIAKQLPITEQPDEIPTMSVGIYGKDEDFFTLKGIIEGVMRLCGAHTQYEVSHEPYLRRLLRQTTRLQPFSARYTRQLPPSTVLTAAYMLRKLSLMYCLI